MALADPVHVSRSTKVKTRSSECEVSRRIEPHPQAKIPCFAYGLLHAVCTFFNAILVVEYASGFDDSFQTEGLEQLPTT